MSLSTLRTSNGHDVNLRDPAINIITLSYETKYQNQPVTQSNLTKEKEALAKGDGKLQQLTAKYVDIGDQIIKQSYKMHLTQNRINVMATELSSRYRSAEDIARARQRLAELEEEKREVMFEIQHSLRVSRGPIRGLRIRTDVTDRALSPIPLDHSPPPPEEPETNPITTTSTQTRDSSPVRRTTSDDNALTSGVRQLRRAIGDLDEKVEFKSVFDCDHKTCSICKEDMTREEITVLDCGHCFHFICANRNYFTDRRHRCAMCRTPQGFPPRTPGQAAVLLGEKMDEVFGRTSS